ncbi:hypothetical protein V1512DRAFT_210218, partial [Lipomyces arxii]|uniref:uncharacterized protein n=1 Tax=Lipomyces arxii TaxID=56418 RepID=UPI0034CF4F49
NNSTRSKLSAEKLGEQLENNLKKQSSIYSEMQDLGNDLKSDMSKLVIQTAEFKSDNNALQSENAALKLLLQERESILKNRVADINSLEKALDELHSTMVSADILEAVKSELTDVNEKCKALLSEKIQLEQKLEEMSRLRDSVEAKLYEANNLLSQEKANENKISEKSRIQYESELARREIHVAQLTRDFEMEKANMVKSQNSKLEKLRLQLEKAQEDKSHLQKLLQAETDSRSRSEDMIQRLNEDVTEVADRYKRTLDDFKKLKVQHEEVFVVA